MTAFTRTVSGTVTTNDGWPLPGATVTVIGASGRQLGRAVANTSGHFTAALDDGGPVTVVIAAAGVDPVARIVTVNRHSAHDIGVIVLENPTHRLLPEPGTWRIDQAHSMVRATARHIALSRVEARFTALEGVIVVADPVEASGVSVTIESASIESGNQERDTHLRSTDFLDVKQFPALTFHSTGLTRLDDEQWQLTGWLTIRDITREVTLDARYGGSGPDPWGGTRMAIIATTQLSPGDYAISWNMGLPGGIMAIGPTLRIDLDIQAVLEPPEPILTPVSLFLIRP